LEGSSCIHTRIGFELCAYIKLDKRVGLTIRQLGYPTKNALKHWHREYEQRLDLSAGYVRRPKYSQGQKELAVEHYLEHGRCLAATIKVLGYPSRDLLASCVQELHPETRTRVVGRSRELTPAMKQAAVVSMNRSASVAARLPESERRDLVEAGRTGGR